MKALVLLVLGACGGPRLPYPTAASVAAQQARNPSVTLEELELGRTTVIQACGRCHAPPRPSKESIEDWAEVTEEMAVKAKLSDEEAGRVLAYLQSASVPTE